MPDPGVTSGFVDRNGNPVASESSAELTTRFRAGDIGAMGPVPVRGTDGVIRNVAPEELESQVNAGALIVSPATVAEEERLARREEQYGGIGGALEAIGEGAASTLSFGTSPLALEAAGVPLERQRDVRETWPMLYGAAQIGGAIPAGVAAAASGGSAPAVALGARVGLGTIGRTVATEAAMGALFGAGDAVNEANINNRPLTAEAILASAAIGGTVGAITGRIIGGGVARQEARDAVRSAGDAAQAEAVERALAAGATDAEATAAGRAALAPHAEAYESMVRESRSIMERATDWATSMGERAAARSVGPVTNDAMRFIESETARNITARLEEIGRFAAERRIVGSLMDSPERIFQNSVRVQREAGEGLDGVVRRIVAEADGSDITDGQNILKAYNDIVDDLSKNPSASGKSILRDFEKDARPIAVETTPTGIEARPFDLTTLRQARQNIDEVIDSVRSNSPNAAMDAPVVESLKKLRTAMANEEDAIAESLGIDTLIDYKDAKRSYQLASITRDMAREGFYASFRAPPVDGVVVANVMRWAARLNPAMAVANLVSGVAQRFTTTKGARLLAMATGSQAKEEAMNAASAALGAEIRSAASVMFRRAAKQTAKSAARVFAPRLSPDATRDVAVAVYESQRDGNNVALPARVERLGEIAPGIAAEALDIQRRRAQYLFNHLPGNITTEQSRLRSLERLRGATKPELTKFARRVEAVSDPSVLIEGVRNNTLSAEVVESASIGYPAILDAMKKAAEEELLSRKGEIPMTVRRTIRILEGGNISTLSDSKVVVTLQQTYSNGFQTMPQANGRPKAPNVTTSDYVASQADAVSARISGEGPG